MYPRHNGEVYRAWKRKKQGEREKESTEERAENGVSAFLRGDLQNDLNIYNSPKPNSTPFAPL